MRAAKVTTLRSCFRGPSPKISSSELLTPATPRPKLSVIVPMYNEQESVGPLYQAIVAAVTPLGYSFEMVFVDDGSADRTVAVATELARNDPRLRIVKFRRNYGQTAALQAGIQQATGEVIVTLDGDLQNDPLDIPTLVQKLDEGYDLVHGWRKLRHDTLLTRMDDRP